MSDLIPAPSPGGEFIVCQSEDGRTKLDVRLVGQTLWLSQKQLTNSKPCSPRKTNPIEHFASWTRRSRSSPTSSLVRAVLQKNLPLEPSLIIEGKN